jgi:prolyl-tRNA synthetase
MLQSKLFTKTIKESPRDEESKAAQLLIRAGFIDKLASGVYTFLPLGLMTLDKIRKIISEEMESLSAQEILMPTLIPKKILEKTNRWKELDVLFKLEGRTGLKYALGATHEEVVVPLVKKQISSYKELPFAVFQIQNKFRDELRAKSGILRTREFLMKDLYSFHSSEEDLNEYYEKVKKSYFKIFKRLGIAEDTYLTLASGGTFSDYSHEFQTVTESGEDTIHTCLKCGIAVNKEIINENYSCPECGGKLSEGKRAIEVGNIFKLKERYTEPFNFKFTNKKGEKEFVTMGCYGIGLPRLIGAAVEISHDSKGIVWSKEMAPFSVHLIALEEGVKKESDKIYQTLQKNKVEVIYDDREEKNPGEKFADCDLIGIPYRIVVSKKTLDKKSVEVKKRNQEKKKLVKTKDLLSFLEK